MVQRLIARENNRLFSVFQFRLFHLSCQLHGHDKRDRHSEKNAEQKGMMI